MRITVVGGGISGLTVAYRLLKRGHDVTCVDAEAQVGGLMRSKRIDGYLCETGPQAMLDSAPDTLDLLRDLNLYDQRVSARPEAARRFVLARGKLRVVPSHPLKLLFSDALTLAGKWRLMREPKVPARDFKNPDDDETIFDFAERRLGTEVAENLVAPAIMGIYAGDARKLSVRACVPKLIEMESQYGSLFKGLRARRKQGVRPGKLFSFTEGLQTIPTTIATELGTRLVHGRATKIYDSAGKWMVDVEGLGDQGSPPPIPPADHLILAAGANATANLLDDVAPAAAVGLRQIPTAPAAVVSLGFSKTNIGMDLAGYGFLAKRGEGADLLGVQYESSTFAGRAPEGHVLLRAIVGGVFKPDAVEKADDELIESVLTDLTRVAGLRANPDFTAVFRHNAAIPQYELGHPALVRNVEEACRQHLGLHLLGYALKGIGVNDCIRNATELATLLDSAS